MEKKDDSFNIKYFHKGYLMAINDIRVRLAEMTIHTKLVSANNMEEMLIKLVREEIGKKIS